MTNTDNSGDGPDPLVYQCKLPLSTRTLTHVAGLLRAHLKAIASRRRKLPPGMIAVIVIAALRHDQRLSDLAGAYQVAPSTVRRWRDEILALPAARAPGLDRALKQVAACGRQAVLIDGTLIPTRRRTGRDNRPNYCGKHHRHGLHFLALTDEQGRLIRISAARRGRTHDITAARHDKILAHLRAAGLGALADLGFLGVNDDPHDPVIITGYQATRTRKLTTGQKRANQVLSAARALVEHGFAHPKNWRILTRLRTDPAKATTLLRALFVLTNLEVNRSQTIKSADTRPRHARVLINSATQAHLNCTSKMTTAQCAGLRRSAGSVTESQGAGMADNDV